MDKSNSLMLPIPGFPGYLVTADGCVSRDDPEARAVNIKKVGAYLYAALKPKGTGHVVYRNVGVLVLLAFVGPKPAEGMMCLHRNDVGNDNRLENLYWGTATQNALDRTRNRCRLQ